MKIVFVSTKNLNVENSEKKIQMLGMFKKHKDANKVLERFAIPRALKDQWNPAVFDKGTGQSGGYEYKYYVLDSFENVNPQPIVTLTEFI